MKDEVFIVIANGNRDKTASQLEEAGFIYGDHYCFIHELGLLLDFPDFGEHVVSVIPSEARLSDYKKFCEYYGEDFVSETIRLWELNDGRVDWSCFEGNDDVIIFDREDRFETYFSHKTGSVHSLSFWTAGMMLPSVIFARTELAEGTNLPLCRNRTDNYVEIADLNGHFNLAACCPVYFKASWYGCVGFRDFREVWHSKLARAARLSVINRTYIACTDKCPFIAFKNIKYLSDDEYNSDDYQIEAPDYPEIVTLNFDESCNLHCTFCREHMEFCTGEERLNKDRMAEAIQNSLITAPGVKEIRLAGNGEVFASSSYQKILYDKRNSGKTLYIVTNGTLLHKADFERIREIYPRINISVSFGAFEKRNYEKLWRGANFEQTVKNIEMVAAMRRRGEIDYLGVYYMCTTESYLALPDVCKWGENIGIDDIRLYRLFPKAELQGKEYYEMSLFDDNGNMLEKYRDFFKSEIFTHPIFKTGNVISEL